jgi:hypothetical protein
VLGFGELRDRRGAAPREGFSEFVVRLFQCGLLVRIVVVEDLRAGELDFRQGDGSLTGKMKHQALSLP